MVSPTVDRRFGLVGNIPMKAPVTVLAASNITQSGQQTIDGVAVLALNASGVPDRVLCVGQTTASQNGIWDVSTGGWTRSLDANGNYDFGQGTTVLVNQGTAYAGSYWKISTAGPITIGTTSINWTQALVNALTTGLVSQLVGIYPNTSDKRWFYASGYVTAGDDGGGDFYWDQTSTATHDGGAVIKPTAAGATGRWIRVLYDREVCPEMWGAIKFNTYTDTTDSTSAVQAMFDFLPTQADTHTSPYRVKLLGRYGISATINIIALHGSTIEGNSSWHQLSSGFHWVGAISAASLTKDFIYVAGCRRTTFKSFSVSAAEGAVNHLRAAFSLSSQIDATLSGGSQQEKLNFHDIRIGFYDGFEGQTGSTTVKQFTYGFWAYETGAQYGNNDFHDFHRCKILNCTYGMYNDTTQGVAWRTYGTLIERCDYGHYVKSGSLYCTAPEFLLMNNTIFVMGASTAFTITLKVLDIGTEQCYGPLLDFQANGQARFHNGGFDCLVNPANNAIINPAFSKLIMANVNSWFQLTLDNVTNGVRGYTGNIDVSAANTYRRLLFLNVDKSKFPLAYSDVTSDSRYYVEYADGYNAPASTDYRQGRGSQQLHGTMNTALADNREEIDASEIFLGNSYYGAVARVRQIVLKTGVMSGASKTLAAFLPAGVVLLAPPSLLLTINLAGPLTAVQIGDGTTAARWGTHNANHDRDVRRTPASDIANTTDAGPVYIKTATSVVLTAVGGNFTTEYGVVTALVMDVAGKLYRQSIDGVA